MAYSFKKQTHKSKGRAGKIPHPGGASPHSGARKNKLRKVLEAREDSFAKRKREENKKRKPKSFSELYKPKPPPRQAEVYERWNPKKDEDNKNKPKVKLVIPEEIKPVTPEKKYGGKITYKMSGGQVVDSSYD
jgi:hypothetical protein|tara:strand:+ start:358 stop:756 length:399 start_codon:yes stop_codon:yes gene_type:complete